MLLLVFGAALYVALWKGRHREERSPSPNAPRVPQSVQIGEPMPTPVGKTNYTPPPHPVQLASGMHNLLTRVSDQNLSKNERQSAARALAAMQSPDALESTKGLLKSAPLQVRVALAEGLGANASSEASAMLRELLNSPEQALQLGAIRGLAERADPESVSMLGRVLASETTSEAAKIESAIALGDIQVPEATEALVSAAATAQDGAVLNQLVQALGQKPFSNTEAFYTGFLSRPDVAPDQKAAALLSLGSAGPEASELLLSHCSNPDSHLRKAAASALAMSAAPGLGERVVSLLQRESVPAVRAELYGVLHQAEELPVAAVLAMAKSETDSHARISVLHLAAVRASEHSEQELSAFFNLNAVPELARIALAGGDPQQRASAVSVLAQAATPEAKAALSQVASQSNEVRIREAAQLALRKFGR